MKKSINYKVILIVFCIFLISIFVKYFVFFQDDFVKVLIIHTPTSNEYVNIYQYFNQSLITNLKVNEINISDLNKVKLKDFQAVYLDKSLLNQDDFKHSQVQFIDYVKNGGNMLLLNEFYDSFPKDFIGAKEFVKVNSRPQKLDLPNVGYNLLGIQDIINDFYSDYSNFSDFDKQQNLINGMGLIPSTASSIASFNGASIYSMNKYGKGFVFFTNSILPNSEYSIGFDFRNGNKVDEKKNYLNYSVASANYLLNNEFISFILKESKGYVTKKVLGPYGRPAMAWQNHFETLTPMRDGAMEKWIDLLKSYKQIPSFTLIRSAYDWGDWEESITYHKNISLDQKLTFIGEEDNSHYSSGSHLYEDNKYLSLKNYPEYKSLADPIDLPFRAYPYAEDINNDGKLDLFVGSSDGFIYFYEGTGAKDNWIISKKTKLLNDENIEINVGKYASIILYDLDFDGKKDLIVGNGDGYVYYFNNLNNYKFGNRELLIPKSNDKKIIAPDIGDLDGDKVDDLVLGDENGNLIFQKGEIKNNRLTFHNESLLKDFNGKEISVGRFSAPKCVDINGDGLKDLIIGNNQGYITKYINMGTYFKEDGFIDGQTFNQFGNKHIWGGRNTVPFLVDINTDGKLDLITGQLEFGMAIPIDSPNFPYKNELKKSIEYAKKNFVYMQPHIFFHNYKSEEQERREINLHKTAFLFYDIPWGTGANQHTWRVNAHGYSQTFNSELSEGLWWNSGFRPPNNPIEPTYGTEYALSIPFLLTDGIDTKDFIIFNPAPIASMFKSKYEDLSKHDIPVSYFNHMEYQIVKDEGVRALEKTATFLDEFRNINDYNFMTEEQMFKSFMSVMKAKISSTYNPLENIFNNFQNKLRTMQHFTIYLNTKIDPSYKISDNYKNVVGIKLEVGEKYLSSPINTNSDVYIRKGNDLYFSIDKPINVFVARLNERSHIERVNLPVKINNEGNNLDVKFLEKGLQQIKIFAPKGIKILSEGWDELKENDSYTLTRFGDVTDLKLIYK